MSKEQNFKKLEWLKISLLDRVKRIYNPSRDLKCLSNQIKSHFKELQNHTLLTDKREALLPHEFQIEWVTKDGSIPILENDQLDEIFSMHSISNEPKVPRFNLRVVVNDEGDIDFVNDRIDELKSSIYHDESANGAEQFKSSYLTSSEIGELQAKLRAQNIENAKQELQLLEEIKSELSEEEEQANRDDESCSSSDTDMEEEDRKMLQEFRHKIRMEVEKKVIGLFDQEASLEKLEEEKIEDEVLQNEVQPHDRIENSQQIDISVHLSNNNNKDLRQSAIEPLLQTFKNFFGKKIVPKDKELFSQIVGSQQELYIESRAGQNCTLTWKVQNKTESDWPRNLQLILVYSDPVALINNQTLNRVLKQGETEDIEINLFIPKDIKESHQMVMFRLKDCHGTLGFLGQPLIAFIKVNKDDLNQSQMEPLNASQQRARAQSEDFTVYNLNDEQLLGMASVLVDEGLGSFDRCYSAIRCLRGNIKKAREFLSHMIFYECGF